MSDSTFTPTLTPLQPTAPATTIKSMRVAEAIRPAASRSSLEQFRVTQDFSQATTEPQQSLIQVCKPRKDIFFRAHPEWQFLAWVLDYEQRNYLVLPSVAEDVEGLAKLRHLVPCITKDGDVFVWPLGQIKTIGQTDAWTLSAHRTLTASRLAWVRMFSHLTSGAYKSIQAKAGWPEPHWPETDLNSLIQQAFNDSVIDDSDHPVLRALRGEVA